MVRWYSGMISFPNITVYPSIVKPIFNCMNSGEKMTSKDPSSVVTNRASGEMIDHAASKIFVRDFEPIISDEPASRGGNNSGPSPLEYILAALCA